MEYLRVACPACELFWIYETPSRRWNGEPLVICACGEAIRICEQRTIGNYRYAVAMLIEPDSGSEYAWSHILHRMVRIGRRC